jgi:glycerol-3-phosphate dehydrogenase (NAD(P)+)
MKVAVIGAGSFGTALAITASRGGNDVRLWGRRPHFASELRAGFGTDEAGARVPLPANVRPSSDVAEALDGAEIVVLVIPSHAVRSVLREMRPNLSHKMVFVSAAKGIETDTLMRMSEVAFDELKDDFDPRFVALSGPSFAAEVVKGMPTAVVAACYAEEWARLVQRALSSASFRIYTNTDVVGVELGGALKNVIAIATGAVTGLGLGHNAVAAIITRGLAEITRLAVALGGRDETLAGLAGVGDLVLTCTGGLSRNRFVGVELGRGRTLDDILGGMNEVAEGVKTTEAARALGVRTGVELPITEAIHSLLYERRDPRAVAEALMGRPLRRE